MIKSEEYIMDTLVTFEKVIFFKKINIQNIYILIL